MNENQITFIMVMACFSLGASVGVLILMGMPLPEEPEPYMTCEYFEDEGSQWFHCTEPVGSVYCDDMPAWAANESFKCVWRD